ncbi:MAG: division/cell wall cluster transcriptional repressor MraZ [Bacteroidota bacterium]
MRQLLGEYDCKIDAKGRMRVPASLLRQLEEEDTNIFVINRGVERCLTLYPKNVWEGISAKVNRLNQYIKKNRDFVRYFYRGATELAPDSADRILLSKRLLAYAGIEKEVILLAINDRIEIWSKSAYEKMLDEEPDDFSDLAEDVWGNEPPMGSSDTDDNQDKFS